MLSVTQVTSTVEPPPIYSILWEWVYHRQSVTSTVEPPPIKFQFFSNLVIFIIANANGREFFLWRLYTVLEFRILLFLLFWYVSPAIQFIKRCLFLFFKWSFFLCWECWVEYNLSYILTEILLVNPRKPWTSLQIGIGWWCKHEGIWLVTKSSLKNTFPS